MTAAVTNPDVFTTGGETLAANNFQNPAARVNGKPTEGDDGWRFRSVKSGLIDVSVGGHDMTETDRYLAAGHTRVYFDSGLRRDFDTNAFEEITASIDAAKNAVDEAISNHADVVTLRRIAAQLSQCEADLTAARLKLAETDEAFQAAVVSGKSTSKLTTDMDGLNSRIASLDRQHELLTKAKTEAAAKAKAVVQPIVTNIAKRYRDEANVECGQAREAILAAIAPYLHTFFVGRWKVEAANQINNPLNVAKLQRDLEA